ncbi:hypothetical protein R3P38DRAFT_667913 [Favolaschia claudopus]|uniref:Uncharacterized protein n=1 Tax=Favolaschia claudopus TaxID=2862362 RepID=A0AAW0E9B8_9AGAR
MTKDVSGILGEWMLKGWILTDKTCRNPGCHVPLMRSPAAKSPVIHFCANCDGGPDGSPAAQQPSNTSVSSSSSHFSRPSTPPTEVSSTLSSPVFAPPPETEESRRRRQQSDAASAAIGQKLLQGWAMLAEECPNENCFGIPLVRPPKPGGEKDPRKECVICRTVYVTELDWAGRERLIPQNLSKDKPAADGKDDAPQTKISDLNDLNPRIEAKSTVEVPLPMLLPPLALDTTPAAHSSVTTTTTMSALDSSLDNSVQSLESTMRSLSTRLTALTSAHADTSSIGAAADAIFKVSSALGQVRQVQWAERQHSQRS